MAGKKILPILMLSVLATWTLPAQKSREGQEKADRNLAREEQEDYYQKWLKQDVAYIISTEEKQIFNELHTPEEKEQFIEQFWFRRDPDPLTANNEFKEEHYRRIAYANEHFTSGDPGWLTDRGRVYITQGPPDNIETRPTGGAYVRKIEEGGGSTSVYPMERWTYRHIEGVGDNIELEFVDASGTGAYKLAVFDWEKDALTMTGGGNTLLEDLGITKRADRPELTPAAGGAGYGPTNWFRRNGDTPFARYERFAKVTGTPVTKYQDLKELVKVNISYANLPFQIREDYFRLNEAQALVPVTLQVQNSDLTFKLENGQHTARMAVYGIVSSMTNRIVTEFEDDFVVRYKPEELADGLQKSSVYQKILTIDLNSRNKLDVVIKDLETGKTGVIRKAISPPKFDEATLQGSSLLLSDQIQPLDQIPEENEMFVIGDIRVLPRFDGEYSPSMPLGIYYQVYNAGVDQTTLEPSLRVTYSLLKNGQLLKAATDEGGESTQYFSGRRVVLMKQLSLEGLEPGKYQVEIEVQDRLSNQTIKQVGDFAVVAG